MDIVLVKCVINFLYYYKDLDIVLRDSINCNIGDSNEILNNL